MSNMSNENNETMPPQIILVPLIIGVFMLVFLAIGLTSIDNSRKLSVEIGEHSYSLQAHSSDEYDSLKEHLKGAGFKFTERNNSN